jgi:hypothetical protein
VAADALARGGALAGLQLAEAFFAAAKGGVAMATTANEKTGAVFARFGCKPVTWTREFWRAPATLAQQIRTCRGASSRVAGRLLAGPGGRVIVGTLGRCYRRLHHRPSVPIPHGCRLETTMPRLAGDLGWLWEGFIWGKAPRSVRDRGGRISVDRSQDYLDWRYVRHPERENLRVLVVRDRDGHPIGAAIIFFDDRSARRLALVEELIVLPHRMEVLRTLLCATVRLTCDHEVDYVVTMAGRHGTRPVFWRLGFENRARSAPAMLVKPPEQLEPSALGAAGAGSLEDRLEFWHGEMF